MDESIASDQDGSSPTGFRHFEQSLRIVDVLESLNLTHETRAGIGGHSKGRKDLSSFDGEPTSTLEAAVVRISDRIAYLNHDLDDALRSGIISEAPRQFAGLGDTQGSRIGAMVLDVVSNSLERPCIVMSEGMLETSNLLKEWLFEKVYLSYPIRYPDVSKAKALVGELYLHFRQPGNLPPEYLGKQGAVDYIAGMTDRFAMDLYRRLKLPDAWPLP